MELFFWNSRMGFCSEVFTKFLWSSFFGIHEWDSATQFPQSSALKIKTPKTNLKINFHSFLGFLFIRDHDGIRTHTPCSTTPSRWRVYQFLHVA
jgi:hypothetical protein